MSIDGRTSTVYWRGQALRGLLRGPLVGHVDEVEPADLLRRLPRKREVPPRERSFGPLPPVAVMAHREAPVRAGEGVAGNEPTVRIHRLFEGVVRVDKLLSLLRRGLGPRRFVVRDEQEEANQASSAGAGTQTRTSMAPSPSARVPQTSSRSSRLSELTR